MAGQVFGLDFGTTNSLITSIDTRSGRLRPYTSIEDSRPHPSTVWYRAGKVIVGREARDHLNEGGDSISGEFIRSPKRLLMNQAAVTVDGTQYDPREIVSEVLSFLRRDAAAVERGAMAAEVDRAVFTIPVNLDGNGRRALREAARMAGISVVQFVHEPLAALFGWLRSQPDYEKRLAQLDGRRVLVFDWGGGTLDLTLCLIHDGKLIQIANDGDNEVGGDYFDEILRSRVRERHAQAHGIEHVTSLENSTAGVRLLNECELAKISLSQLDELTLFVPNYLRNERGRDLEIDVTKADVEQWTGGLIDRGLSAIDRLLERTGLSPQEVELCLPTGGMVNVPAIRAGLLQRFPGRVARLDNGDRIISEGAAWIAHDNLRLTLAKPIELTDPYGGHVEIVDAAQILPLENEHPVVHKTQYYCTDPRDGVARFQFSRPVKAARAGPNSPRRPYAVMQVRVSPFLPPFAERLDVEISIDHDYVACIDLESTMTGSGATCEIHDLEFALSLGREGGMQRQRRDEQPDHDAADDEIRRRSASNVQVKTNVSARSNAWHLVPGDLVTKYRERWFDVHSQNADPRQRKEYENYLPCAVCKRLLAVIEMEGCDCGHALSRVDAAKRLAGLGLSENRLTF